MNNLFWYKFLVLTRQVVLFALLLTVFHLLYTVSGTHSLIIVGLLSIDWVLKTITKDALWGIYENLITKSK